MSFFKRLGDHRSNRLGIINFRHSEKYARINLTPRHLRRILREPPFVSFIGRRGWTDVVQQISFPGGMPQHKQASKQVSMSATGE